jgi:ATP-dependent helicase/nuclease subunit A
MAKHKRRPPPDQNQRELIVRELDRTMLVEAAAGTGKTTSMIARMVALLAAGRCQVDTLAAVTFTRKAAAEIRGRLQLELERVVHESAGDERARLQDALRHIERCFVGTIHSFCARLLRERPVEANVDVAFQEIDDAIDRALRDQAWQEHVESLVATDSPIVSELEEKGMKLWQRTRRQDPIVGELEELGLEVAQLGPAFMKMAEFPDVQEWPAPPVDMPDLSNARRELRLYAEHIRTLIPSLPDDPGNDQLIPKYRQIDRMMSYVDVEKPAGLIELLDQFTEFEIGDIVQRRWPTKGLGKAELTRWNDFTQRHAAPLRKAWREHCYAPVLRAIRPAKDIYDRLRRENTQLNFQDLLLRAVDLLRDKPQIRQYFRKRFTHLLVDEFQDTDPIQAEVMLLLTADNPDETDWQKCRPADGSLFVVGDPKQSIYRFRRADIVTYIKVKRIIAHGGGLIVPLAANFRTVEPIIDWINSTFQQSFPSEASNYSPENHPLQLGRDGGSNGDVSGIARLQIPAEHRTEEQLANFEAEIIARRIRHTLDAGLTVPRTEREREAGIGPQARPEDFLVIARTKKRLSLYGQKLQEYGIPNQVTGGSAVNEVVELWLLYTCLRAVTRPDDQLALLAALRSELFGISDAVLYNFKRAGGTFSFHAPIPEEMVPDSKVILTDAFTRLQQYARWLAKLPSVSAIERVAIDLGLWPRSCTRRDGSLQAGSLGKGLELLRSAAHSAVATAADLVDHLGQIIDHDESHDGLPARPEQDAPVRVMNLHQAKGLEAPVVFLAYPTGQRQYPPEMHIDRTGDQVRGYLMIQGEFRGRRHRPVLAHPVGWDRFADEEQRFLDAENNRLLYVATTRTGTQLTISQRAFRNDANPWQPFAQRLTNCPDVQVPESHDAKPASSLVLAQIDVTNEVASITKQWNDASAPTYSVLAAKESALSGPRGRKPRGAGEHGTEWGTVIHILLEAAMAGPRLDLRSLALSSLTEQGLDPSLADTAVETVQAVMRSDIWTRAQAGSKRFAEVPFETLTKYTGSHGAVPTLVRGVIDLVFREPAGWVVVDYKTEQVPKESLADLVAYYRDQLVTYADTWESMVGEPVHELGIFFTHSRHYVLVPR